jgi:hypothetical protein
MIRSAKVHLWEVDFPWTFAADCAIVSDAENSRCV